MNSYSYAQYIVLLVYFVVLKGFLLVCFSCFSYRYALLLHIYLAFEPPGFRIKKTNVNIVFYSLVSHLSFRHYASVGRASAKFTRPKGNFTYRLSYSRSLKWKSFWFVLFRVTSQKSRHQVSRQQMLTLFVLFKIAKMKSLPSSHQNGTLYLKLYCQINYRLIGSRYKAAI